MALAIDIIILVLMLVCVLLGYKRGLTKSVIKILSFVIAIVIAFILFKPISNFVIQNTTFDDNIKNSIVELVSNDVTENGEIKEDTNLPETMVNYINKQIGESVEQTKDAIVNKVAEDISILAVNACVLIAVFIIARVLLTFVKALSSLVTDLPIIKQVDKIGGIIYGLAESLLIIFVVLAIISLISPMIESSGIITAINKSMVGSVFYNNNFILKIIF